MDEPPTKLPPLHPAVCADSARDAEIKAAMAEVEALFAVGDVVFPQPPTDEMLRCWAAPFKKFNLDDREGPGTDSDYKVVDRTYVYTLSAAALERSASYCGRVEVRNAAAMAELKRTADEDVWTGAVRAGVRKDLLRSWNRVLFPLAGLAVDPAADGDYGAFAEIAPSGCVTVHLLEPKGDENTRAGSDDEGE